MRNDLYDLDQELRDLIERKFEEATGGATDVARGVTRARRRIARNAVAATLVIARGEARGHQPRPFSDGAR